MKATLRRLSVIYGTERSFFFLSDHHFDMLLSTYQISAPTLLPTYRDSIGLQADPAFGEGRRAGALFFARHRDYFIVTRNFTVIYRDLVPYNCFTVTLGFASVYRDWQKTSHRDPSLTLWAGSDARN
jgi:hypothetical protein